MSAHESSAPVPVGEAGTGTDGQLWFLVRGLPKPKGSLRAVGKGRLVEQIDNRPWRDAVTWHAADAMRRFRRPMLTGPVCVDMLLTVPRPKSASKTRRTFPITRASGDVDKHARLILDALTDAGMIHDDSQVVHLSVHKDYADPADGPGAIIHVAPWGG